jgi:hypothetical protein
VAELESTLKQEKLMCEAEKNMLRDEHREKEEQLEAENKRLREMLVDHDADSDGHTGNRMRVRSKRLSVNQIKNGAVGDRVDDDHNFVTGSQLDDVVEGNEDAEDKHRPAPEPEPEPEPGLVLVLQSTTERAEQSEIVRTHSSLQTPTPTFESEQAQSVLIQAPDLTEESTRVELPRGLKNTTLEDLKELFIRQIQSPLATDQLAVRVKDKDLEAVHSRVSLALVGVSDGATLHISQQTGTRSVREDTLPKADPAELRHTSSESTEHEDDAEDDTLQRSTTADQDAMMSDLEEHERLVQQLEEDETDTSEADPAELSANMLDDVVAGQHAVQEEPDAS